jgi:hypothetical protein
MKSRTHQSKHVQRLLVIVDVIQQLLAKRFIANNGNYLTAETFQSIINIEPAKGQSLGDAAALVDSKTVRANVLQAKECMVCAKGALLLSYIGRFNSVDGAHLYGCLSNGGMEQHAKQITSLFSHNLLGEIEAAFEGIWYVEPSPKIEKADRERLYQWRGDVARIVKKELNKRIK